MAVCGSMRVIKRASGRCVNWHYWSDHHQLLHAAPDVREGDEWGDCFLWRGWPPIV